MQVRAPLESEQQKLKRIWEICFYEDSKESIDFYFLNAYKNKNALVCTENDEIIGMLHILPVVLKNEGNLLNGGYIYAASTLPDHRLKGVLKALDNEAQKLSKSKGYSFLTLVPAKNTLFNMYKKLGYETMFFLNEAHINPYEYSTKSIKTEITSLKGQKHIILRESFLNSLKVSLRFNFEYQKYFYNFLDFDGFKSAFVKNELGCGYITYKQFDDTLIIAETSLKKDSLLASALSIKNAFNVNKITVFSALDLAFDGFNKPYGMIKFLEDNIKIPDGANPYMNLMLE